MFVGTEKNILIKYVNGLYNVIWNGPAAVIVFFVISGFCIHFPYRNSRKDPQWLLFCVKRSLRLFVPLAAIFIVQKIIVNDNPFNVNGVNFWYSIVGWSLTSELLYYLSYPLLLKVSKMNGWVPLFTITFFSSMIIILLDYKMMDYPSYGTIGNMILGLPCWILGVLLAEEYDCLQMRKIGFLKLNMIRFSIIGLSSLCYGFYLYFQIGFPVTLNFFALAVFIWLSFEISQNHIRTSKYLEWGGKWSYSIYLTHWPLYLFFNEINMISYSPRLVWVTQLLFILTGAYCFYIIFEKTSHALIRKIRF